MTYFPPENAPLNAPAERASLGLYNAAHRNFTIGYTDVVLRNPLTDEFFFPVRDTEPEKGSTWFIGGRMNVGQTVGESAASHVKRDTGLDIADGRFSDVSHFGIAHVTEREGQEPTVRHAMNNVLVANLNPEEVEELNSVVAAGKLSKEYSGGTWYNPKTDKKELLPPLKQFLRDFFDRQVMVDAVHGMAIEEYVESYGHKPDNKPEAVSPVK